MRELGFSESQLQQAINTAYVRHVFEVSGHWIFANVPSLFDEFELGWDTGFYFPWLLHRPNIDHQGCNFFLQYKLSGLLTSSGAKQWSYWNSEYYRFKIPHSTRDNSGKFVDDYHQWDRLKELADSNYPTFYATNSTINKDELKKHYYAGTLLDTTPMLDVRSVSNPHKLVTFTSRSSYFLMHSEKEEINKTSFTNVIEQVNKIPRKNLNESNVELLKFLEDLGQNDVSWKNDISKISQFDYNVIPKDLKQWVKHSMISSFIHKHIGVRMMWLPKIG